MTPPEVEARAARPPYLLAGAVGALLGAVLGLPLWRSMTRLPLERAFQMEALPRPLGMLWWKEIKGLSLMVEGLERVLVAVAVLLMLGAFLLLARSLNPRFTLRLDNEAGQRKGGAAWMDIPLLLRCGLAALFSLWLVGAGWPIGELIARGQGAAFLTQLAGGLPALTQRLPGVFQPLALSVTLIPALWLLWGPSGLAHLPGKPQEGPVLPWALLAGLAAVPGVLLLFPLRGWLLEVSRAFSLVDRSGWNALFLSALLLPALGTAYLAAVAGIFRPRPLAGKAWGGYLAGATVLFLTGMLVTDRVHQRLRGWGLESPGLASELRLQGSPLRRFAMVLLPNGQVLASSPSDSSSMEGGRDRIACSNQTHGVVAEYLKDHQYRTLLADRAFLHLHACNSLDWITVQNLRVNMELLKRVPSPLAAQYLIEKLSTCPVKPETRAILDALADPGQFTPPTEEGRSWFAMAYRRFGDSKRSREFLKAGSRPGAQTRDLLGGIAPLTDGVVRGRLANEVQDQGGLRLGLVGVGSFRAILGLCPPSAWRWVTDLAYTDKDGRFEFRNVPEGDYLLVATGGGIGRDARQPLVTPAPGMIRVDRFHSVVVLPNMQLRYEGRPPRVMPGEVTARAEPPKARVPRVRQSSRT